MIFKKNSIYILCLLYSYNKFITLKSFLPYLVGYNMGRRIGSLQESLDRLLITFPIHKAILQFMQGSCQ